jgi:predicted NUDIX family phosphoesterase
MEKVLVVKTEKLSKYIEGKTGLLKEDNDKLLDIIINEHEFIWRPDAEEDPSYKQIIPYVVLTQGDKIFATRRLNKGGESRLHGKLSIGIGGHINPVDETDPKAVLMRGLERELDEEVAIEHRGALVPQGLINDDTNGVGSVHLGLCFKMEVQGQVAVKETEKLTGGWFTLDELKAEYDNMETWTQIALSVVE